MKQNVKDYENEIQKDIMEIKEILKRMQESIDKLEKAVYSNNLAIVDYDIATPTTQACNINKV